ncbi:MAG TPA: hypothetical protein VL523_19140 [Terriglobia bacterium]|nr:hypothetical protein [Terriglobia bacterium]
MPFVLQERGSLGDKTSLLVEATTRSGLNPGRPRGAVSAAYGSFASPATSLSLESGGTTLGNFLAFDGTASRRFLDALELQPLHDSGSAATHVFFSL